MCTVSVSSPDTSYYENWPGPNSISRVCFNRNGTKWRRSWQNKNKRKEKQIRRWNKLKTKQNMEQSGHSNTVGNQAGRGWHLKMVKWHQTRTRWAAWPTTSSNNIDQDRSIMSLLLLCVTKVMIISSIVCLSVHPSLRHALLLLAPQRDKWHSNNNNIEFYWNHFVHLSLNNKCIYLI